MKPFLSGRAQSSTSPLQPLTSPIVKDGGPRVSSHGHIARKAPNDPESAPTIECIKQGDKVVRMIITCSCGEKIEVDCLYPGMG